MYTCNGMHTCRIPHPDVWEALNILGVASQLKVALQSDGTLQDIDGYSQLILEQVLWTGSQPVSCQTYSMAAAHSMALGM